MTTETTLAPTEREQFEAWVRSEFPGVKLRRKGKFYNHPPTSEWWLIWQAARAQPAPQGPALIPLTDGQVEKLGEVGPVYAPGGVVSRLPQQYRRELEARFRRGLRAGEAAHGIGKEPTCPPTA